VNRRDLVVKGALALAILSKLQLAKSQTKPLQVGVLPNVSARVLATQYEPFQAHLTQKIDRQVIVSTAPDWSSFYRNVKADQYDLVVAAVHVARLMQVDLGLRPLANYQPNVKGLFVTTKASAEKNVQVVKGSQVALANPASLVAFEAERWLDRQGLKVEADYKILKVRGDDSVGLTLIRGESAAGVLSMGEFNSHPPAIRDQLKIYRVFVEVPSFVVMASPRLTQEMTTTFAKQLAEFSEASAEGKLFEERTGFKIKGNVNDKDLQAMDVFLDKTRRLIA
jgi:phosphonate transport system substrate-binding protein